SALFLRHRLVAQPLDDQHAVPVADLHVDPIADDEVAVGLGGLAVDADAVEVHGVGRLSAGLVHAGDVQPFVETDGHGGSVADWYSMGHADPARGVRGPGRAGAGGIDGGTG